MYTDSAVYAPMSVRERTAGTNQSSSVACFSTTTSRGTHWMDVGGEAGVGVGRRRNLIDLEVGE